MQSAVESKPCVIQVFPSKNVQCSWNLHFFLISFFTLFFCCICHLNILKYMFLFFLLQMLQNKFQHSFISTVKKNSKWTSCNFYDFDSLFKKKLKTCGLIWILWTEWMQIFFYIYFYVFVGQFFFSRNYLNSERII